MNDRAFRKVHQAFTEPLSAPKPKPLNQVSLIINYHAMSAMVAPGHVHDKEGSTTSWRALVLAVAPVLHRLSPVPQKSRLKIITGVCLSSFSGRDVITQSGLAEV